MLLLPGLSLGAKPGEGGAYLETRVSRDKVIRGENIVYEVVLVSPDPRIEGVELASFPLFEGIEVSRSAPDSKLSETKIKGKPYYTAVVDRYFLRMPSEGKFTIKGGDYRIGFYKQQEYYDPFWGRTVGNVVNAEQLSAPSVAVKVAGLPQRSQPSDFSGAVGDFEITVEASDGANGEDIPLMVTISGLGSLDGVSLPDIPSMLPEGLQFKSMTDNISHFVKDGELGSEVEIECVVMPKREGRFIIDSIRFSFFNSYTGKYETITAPVLEIEAGSGLPGSGKPPVIMEI